jgi:glycerol-3-phosphate dehydrogenase (NAD(P)+)
MSCEDVAVIGAGSWGTTLAKIAAENGHRVLLWGRDEAHCSAIEQTRVNERYLPGITLPSQLEATTDLQRCCETCRLIFVVVPSHGFRAVANQMGDFIDGEHVVVHCTKGIEQDTHKRMSEVLREETPTRKIGVLAGPNLSVELAKLPAGGDARRIALQRGLSAGPTRAA